MARHVIAPVDELPPGTRKFLTIEERPIAVFNIKGEFFGLLNRCPHQGAALCEGPLIGLAQSSDPGEIQYTRLGEILRCPWHGWEFDIRTGQSYCDPKRFRTRAGSNQDWPVRMSNSQPCQGHFRISPARLYSYSPGTGEWTKPVSLPRQSGPP